MGPRHEGLKRGNRRHFIRSTAAVALAAYASHAAAGQGLAFPGTPGIAPDSVGRMDPTFVQGLKDVWDGGYGGIGALVALFPYAGPVLELLVNELKQQADGDVDTRFGRLQQRFKDAYTRMDAIQTPWGVPSLGWPINDVHFWNKVTIQDFRQGPWGDGVLIYRPGSNRAPAPIVGRHWTAYVNGDGSDQLLTPINGFLHSDKPWAAGYWVQDFERGYIAERGGRAYVWTVDSRSWLRAL
jgi:hypothetical protein